MKDFIEIWKDAWRTTWYFFFFWMMLGLFGLPLWIVSECTKDTDNNHSIWVFHIILYILYLPFAIRWASKVSGVRPPTRKEAKEMARRSQEEYEQINRKNTSQKK